MSEYKRTFKTIDDAVPHTTNKIYAEGYEDKILHSVVPGPVFTAAETAQLMRMYAHARYVAVQASRGADRCDRENHQRGMIHYIYLLKKAAKVCLDIESKMREWEKS